MQVETFSYDPASGWSAPSFPTLDSERTLLVVFGASGYLDDPAPFEALEKAFPLSRRIGCSTSGEIMGQRLVDGTLACAAVRFRAGEVQVACSAVERVGGSFAAGVDLARSLSRPDLRGVFVLSDGLCVNGSALVDGLNSVLGQSVVATGGLAGDGDRFERTWVLAGERPAAGVVAAAGLYGDTVHIGHGSKGGWDMFGPERVVTRSAGNVLYEIDGNPALELYKRYLGELAAELPASALLFPLALRTNGNGGQEVVRTVQSVDETDQSMTFAGDVPEGSRVQLMQANFDRLVEGASEAGLTSAGSVAGGSCLAIAISCVGRRLVLGERTEEEIEATFDALPPGTSQIGFYSYGEISPHTDFGPCDLHNQTMTLTVLSEE